MMSFSLAVVVVFALFILAVNLAFKDIASEIKGLMCALIAIGIVAIMTLITIR